MIRKNFYNFIKNFKYFFINFIMISLGMFIASAFFLYVSAYILKLQSNDFLEVMKDYFVNSLSNVDFVDIFDLKILKKIFIDMINIGDKYGVNLNLYFFLIGAVSIGIVFGVYKGSISLVEYLYKRKFRNKFTRHGFKSIVVKLLISCITSFLIASILFITKGALLLTMFVYFILDSIELLIVTHYIYFPKINFKKFITSLNALKIIGLFFCSQSVFVLIAALLWIYTPIGSIVIILPFLAYSSTNVYFTVTQYFKAYVDRKELYVKES